MSRRLLAVLTACCVVALSVTAVALAHGTGGGGRHKAARPHHGSAHRAAGQPADFLGAGLWAASVRDLATSLGVDPATLRTAIRQTIAQERDRQLAARGLTTDEIAALKTCRFEHPGVAVPKARRDAPARSARATTSCDAAAYRSALAKLKATAKARPDYAAIKSDLAATLAQKLGKTPDEVLTAVRAELDTRLTQAVQAGWLTQKGHDLALACFDTPNTCDMRALKAEFRLPAPSTPTPPSTSTPAPPGTMMPGGRQTSTPLR